MYTTRRRVNQSIDIHWPGRITEYVTHITSKMKSAPLLFIVLLSIICIVHCKDLIVGSSFNNRLIHQQKAEYNAIPLKKRVKEVFFSDPGQQIIKVSIFCNYFVFDFI